MKEEVFSFDDDDTDVDVYDAYDICDIYDAFIEARSNDEGWDNV